MHGVSEYAEGMDVSIKEENGRYVVVALNEAGFNCTKVDLEQLLEWVANNRSNLYNKYYQHDGKK